MVLKENYYISSFFWSTLSKVLNAILGFVSVPLLLGYFGKGDYGILSIATACNGYMHLLDLGMNVGAVRFFSQWKAVGKYDLINKVAHTNITFYIIVACINSLALIGLAIWGENLFSITHEQFLLLRTCLFILASFSVFNWVTTAFNQLLIADKQMAFTMQMQCVQILLKMSLIIVVLWGELSLSVYFFFSTAILALLIVPYAAKCKKDKLIDNFKPGNNWKEFRIILTFSLSIFALSLFQVTATQSRPILLSMFTENGAEVVTEFRILEVIPMFIIMIGGTFTGIFLPKSSEMIAKGDQQEIKKFAYKWTTLTTVLANILCIPFILSAKEIISAYVGTEYSELSIWLILWCCTVLIQIHTTPGNSLILACGQTKLLVLTTAIACFISMIINIALSKYYGVGSAIIGYLIYVVIVIGLYYVAYYKKILFLSRIKMIKCFLFPTIIAFVVLFLVHSIPIKITIFEYLNERIALILTCVIKTLLWLIPYVSLLPIFKIVSVKDLKNSL